LEPLNLQFLKLALESSQFSAVTFLKLQFTKTVSSKLTPANFAPVKSISVSVEFFNELPSREAWEKLMPVSSVFSNFALSKVA